MAAAAHETGYDRDVHAVGVHLLIPGDLVEERLERAAEAGRIADLAAALGGEVRVATPDGEASVQVPPGMTLGRSLRLKGKGWPLKDGRGDLLLTPVLKLPGQLSAEERQLLEQLRAARSADPRAGWIQAARL